MNKKTDLKVTYNINQYWDVKNPFYVILDMLKKSQLSVEEPHPKYIGFEVMYISEEGLNFLIDYANTSSFLPNITYWGLIMNVARISYQGNLKEVNDSRYGESISNIENFQTIVKFKNELFDRNLKPNNPFGVKKFSEISTNQITPVTKTKSVQKIILNNTSTLTKEQLLWLDENFLRWFDPNDYKLLNQLEYIEELNNINLNSE